MKIAKAMQNDDHHIRVEYKDRWLVRMSRKWYVYTHIPKGSSSILTCLYDGTSEDDAVSVLLGTLIEKRGVL